MSTTFANKLILKNGAKEYRIAHNKSGYAVFVGDTVILDTTNTTATDLCFTTSNTADDAKVLGIMQENVANNGYGRVQVAGPLDNLRADGNTNIAVGDHLSVISGTSYPDYTTGTATFTNGSTAVTGAGTTFTAAMVGRYIRATTHTGMYRISAYTSGTAITIERAFTGATESGVGYTITAKGRAAKAAAGKGGAFAVALAAYTTNDSAGSISAWLFPAPRVDNSATGVTLDNAYDGGAAITVDGAAVSLAGEHATNDVLQLTNATGSGALLDLAQSGTGVDIDGTSSTWSVTAAGLGTFKNVALADGTAPAGTVAYICRDNSGDLNLNALTAKQIELRVAGTNVATFAGAAITLAQAVTVSAGGISVTGNSTVTGDLTVTGSMSWSGVTTIGDTVTVDELIFDTDGSAPAATNCYGVRDNSGDLTFNAVTGKTINLAIAGTDEYLFGASSVDLAANHLDNAGYIIFNAVTLPAGTEVYIGHDNTGDCTINALVGKDILFAIDGTDEVKFDDAAYIFNEAGADRDFRVESDNLAFALAVDAAKDSVVIGDNTDVSDVDVRLRVGNVAKTLGANENASILWVAPTAATTTSAGAGTHAIVSTAYFAEPNITAGTGTITNAATVYINDAPSEGVANHALYVASGNATFKSALNIQVDANYLNMGASNDVSLGWVTGDADNHAFAIALGASNAFHVCASGDIVTDWNVAADTNPALYIHTAANQATNYLKLWHDETDAHIDSVSGVMRFDVDGTEEANLTTNLFNLCGSTLAGSESADGNLALQATSHGTKGYITIENGTEELKIGGTAARAGTQPTNTLTIFNGTAPDNAAALANGIQLFSAAGELKVADAAGNQTTLSPHSEDGDYVIHSTSAAKGRTITIHLEKLVKAIVAREPSLAQFVEDESGFTASPLVKARGRSV